MVDATGTADEDERNACLADGMDLISQRNKILVLSDKHSWECLQAYSKNPIADNTENEKTIRKALKEAKIAKEEKGKMLRTSRKST